MGIVITKGIGNLWADQNTFFCGIITIVAYISICIARRDAVPGYRISKTEAVKWLHTGMVGLVGIQASRTSLRGGGTFPCDVISPTILTLQNTDPYIGDHTRCRGILGKIEVRALENTCPIASGVSVVGLGACLHTGIVLRVAKHSNSPFLTDIHTNWCCCGVIGVICSISPVCAIGSVHVYNPTQDD